MAKEKFTPGKRRTYEDIKTSRIEAFTKLIDNVGIDNVVFFESKDNFVTKEAIEPLINISKAFPILNQLQGRKIDEKVGNEFKTKYFELVKAIENVEDELIDLISVNGYRTIQDRTLKNRVRDSLNKESKEENKAS